MEILTRERKESDAIEYRGKTRKDSLRPAVKIEGRLKGSRALESCHLLQNTPVDRVSSSSISLIIPVRDEEASIGRVTQSLIDQSLAPAEIVIADGGSTDNTRAIIREFIEAGHPIRLIEDSDALPGRARNLAIGAATSEWIAMIDAGTIVEKDWLANLASQSDSADVVLGTYEPILTSFFKECLALAFVAPGRLEGDLYFRGPSTASILMRKQVWDSLGGFPEDLRACEDLIFFDRLETSRFVIKLAPAAIVRWHIPEDLKAVFRRFKTYSLHTLKAGLGNKWHLAVARMYLAGLGLSSLAVIHHWVWAVLPIIGFALRIHRSIRARKPSLKIKHRIGPHTYVVVGMILLWIDLAAFAGLLNYGFLKRR